MVTMIMIFIIIGIIVASIIFAICKKKNVSRNLRMLLTSSCLLIASISPIAIANIQIDNIGAEGEKVAIVGKENIEVFYDKHTDKYFYIDTDDWNLKQRCKKVIIEDDKIKEIVQKYNDVMEHNLRG